MSFKDLELDTLKFDNGWLRGEVAGVAHLRSGMLKLDSSWDNLYRISLSVMKVMSASVPKDDIEVVNGLLDNLLALLRMANVVLVNSRGGVLSEVIDIHDFVQLSKEVEKKVLVIGSGMVNRFEWAVLAFLVMPLAESWQKHYDLLIAVCDGLGEDLSGGDVDFVNRLILAEEHRLVDEAVAGIHRRIHEWPLSLGVEAWVGNARREFHAMRHLGVEGSLGHVISKLSFPEVL